MTGQEALRIIDSRFETLCERLLEQHQRGALKTIQAAIVSQVWKGEIPDFFGEVGDLSLRDLFSYDPDRYKLLRIYAKTTHNGGKYLRKAL
jgi:hypothetical protein